MSIVERSAAIGAVCSALLAAASLCKFAIQLHPLSQGIVELFVADSDSDNPLVDTVVRCGLVAGSLSVAVGCPRFSVLCALLGAVLSMTVSVIFPCVANLRLRRRQLGAAETALNYAIPLGGVVCSVLSVQMTLQEL